MDADTRIGGPRHSFPPTRHSIVLAAKSANPAIREQAFDDLIAVYWKPIYKVKSLPLGIVFGLAIGAFLAFLVAAMPDPSGKHYYWEIMLPGSLVGIIVGYATQKYGKPARAGSM